MPSNDNPLPTSVYRRSFPAGVSQVTLADEFWLPKYRVLRTVTVHDVFDKFEKDGAFANFDRVAQGLRGGHRGAPWFDGLIFETMRAVADFLAADYDAALDARLDGYIARAAAAQAVDPDGYLNTFVSLMRPEQRWGALGSDQRWTHEEYNAGCLVEAGVHHYRATGKTSLLALGVRFAASMCAYMGPAPRHNVVPSHSLPEEAFLKLYRLLQAEPELARKLEAGEPRQYLELVRFWLEQRGDTTGRIGFAEYAQDHCCVFDQTEAVGHAVRGMLLYTGMAAFGAETDDPRYLKAARRLWEDVVERKLFITGGVGPIKEYEGFGYGYFLPSSGYIETCAGVGLAFWASQMNQAAGAAEYMDVYERVAYNNVLGGVALSGKQYAYENPLQNEGKLHRWEWHSCPCCPPMLLKLYAEMPGLIYAQDGKDLFINLYIGSRAKLALPSGEVELRLETRYPWEGQVRVTLESAPAGEFALYLRRPDWCQAAALRVNGETFAAPLVNGYIQIRRAWKPGDVIELELEMPARRVVSHPFVNETREHAVLQRGPLVYCVEGIDNREIQDPVLPAHPVFHTEQRADLLGGVTLITTHDVQGKELTAIPYFAWDNRAPERPEEDWLKVWLKQENWFAVRQNMDGNGRADWEHKLYRPLDD